MHIAGCFRRSIIVPHLCHRLPPMLFIGRSGNTVDRSLTRWVRSWRPVPAARPFGQGGMLPRYPFIRLSMNPEDYFSPHPVFHTFFGFDSPSVGTFFRESPLTLYSTLFCGLSEKFFQKNFLTLYSTLFSGFTTCRRKLFFRESSSHPIFHTFFAFGRKNYQTFLRKDGRHSLDFANRIRKTSFTKSFFGQRKSRKRKPDRLIPVGALGK